MIQHHFALAACLVVATPTASVAQSPPRVVRTLTDPNNVTGFEDFGADVLTLVGPGTAPIHIASDPLDTIVATGSFQGGSVFAFDSATGNLLWSASGATSSDFFGTSIANVRDVDGDGFEDLAVGAPGFDALSPLRPDAGRVVVLSGTSGAVLRSIQGSQAFEQLGFDVAEMTNLPGIGRTAFPEIAILSRPQAPNMSPPTLMILDGGNGVLISNPPIPASTESIQFAGNFSLLGGMATQTLALAAPSVNAPISIMDVASNMTPIVATLPPPAGGGNWGASMEQLPGFFGLIPDMLFVGAPTLGTNAGAVHLLSAGATTPSNATLILQGNANEELGRSLSFGGDYDADGLLDIAIGGATGARLVFNPTGGGANLFQVLTPSLSVLPSPNGGSSVAFTPDTNGDFFDEVLVGFPGPSAGLAFADFFFGGPSATLTPMAGAGCAGSAGLPVPQMTMSSAAVLGGSFTLTISGVAGYASGLLLSDFALNGPGAMGNVGNGCTLWLPAPITILSFAVVGNSFTTQSFPVPADPSLLGSGAIFASQAVAIPPGTPGLFQFGWSNAVSSTFGW